MLEGGVAVGTLEATYAERLLAGRPVCPRRPRARGRGARGIDPARPADRRRAEPAPLDERSPDALIRASLGARRFPRECRTATGRQRTRGAAHVARKTSSISTARRPRSWSSCSKPRSNGARSQRRTRSSLKNRRRQLETGSSTTFMSRCKRSACEALGRATAARLGRRIGRNLSLAVADLGWSIRLPGDLAFAQSVSRTIATLI